VGGQNTFSCMPRGLPPARHVTWMAEAVAHQRRYQFYPLASHEEAVAHGHVAPRWTSPARAVWVERGGSPARPCEAPP
jgi:hypothetical protein